MGWDYSGFRTSLDRAVTALDRNEAATLCNDLIGHLSDRGGEVYPQNEANALLQILRKKRYFDLMQQVALTLIQTGQTGHQIRRQYAQALLDRGNISAGLAVLEALDRDCGDDPKERAEARGLIGRGYKQLYVNAYKELRLDEHAADNPPVPLHMHYYLQQAVEAYYGVYRLSERKHTWQGVNTVALLCRGERDGVPFNGPPAPRALGQRILDTIEEEERIGDASRWDVATAAEASVAIGDTIRARDRVISYTAASGADAFELASFHRQLTEVWQLDTKSEPGASVLPILRARLLQREGGNIEMPTKELAERAAPPENKAVLEKIFSSDGTVSLLWYQAGLDRCRAVARIEKPFGVPFGTGFLLRGSDLHPTLGDEAVLLTNAHVISDSPGRALPPEDAVIRFEALQPAPGPGETFRADKLIFSSPPTELDATLIRLDKKVSNVPLYPVSNQRPDADGKHRVYIIGHPLGQGLSLSLHDNMLLDYDDVRLHYRAPTQPGSSGSPVFNDKWELIGLHHAGSEDMRRLRGQPGTYEANEGIWVQAIIQQIRQEGLRT